MLKPIHLFFLACFNICFLFSQTTDLSINIEVQNLSGNPISQVNIYQDFQYLITVSNSGNTVNDATIVIDFDDDLTLISSSSQNNTNGASDITDINIIDNVLTASIATMPSNSSVELLILVTAPTNLGGIAVNGTVSPPSNTTDTNPSNNQSIISIDVLDVVIDFTVSHIQIEPSPGTAISAWGDEVTYQFTITNNSSIDFPVNTIDGSLILSSSPNNGQPLAEFISLECIEATNGTVCPSLDGVFGSSSLISSSNIVTAPSIFSLNNDFEITSGGSITFEMVYRYSNSSCSQNEMPIDVNSFIEITLDHANVSSNMSNLVETNLLNAGLCDLIDLCISSEITDPVDTADIEYNEQVTIVTTACNNGPSEGSALFFIQNLSPNVDWNIISINCTGTTGPVECSDFTISNNGQLWVTNTFSLQPNTTITIETIVEFIEPPCNPFPNMEEATIKSEIVLSTPQMVDIDLNNNAHYISIELPQEEPCDIDDVFDLQVTKNQISPVLPEGSSAQNTTEWGEVSYEIIVTNNADAEQAIQVQDHMPVPMSGAVPLKAMLTSVECVATTGTANCFAINNAYMGTLHDGITEDGSFDTFWEILPEDNWILPANSSVTFNVTVDWQPECSPFSIIGENVVRVNYVNDVPENDTDNNVAKVRTYFAPCVDLVVQTYPEFSQVDTNQNFNWIVDISNSTTSSDAIDIVFENTLSSVFTISGTPTCSITSGNATCISSFSTNGNVITGVIPSMEAGSTVSITIPVTAPSFGGAYNNIAEAIPSAANNEELTPETNISINSVQVISPTLEKMFSPDTIYEGGESELIFTVYNIANNPTQSDIAFIDNLPTGVTLVSTPNWINTNGCTATFIGNIGGNFVGLSNLVFPAGVQSCTFSVMVTSDTAGTYLNNFDNFSETNNIDTSQASATLNVIVDMSDVDIEILKTVEPTEVVIGEEVTFTIAATNLGTSVGSEVTILDQLPSGYEFISASVDAGTFDNNTLSWNIPSLEPNEAATLTINATVVSSKELLNIAMLNSLNEIDRDPTNNEDDALVEISNCLIIPQGMSPNKDGLNDVLAIPCIEDYPDNVFKIYNRYGVQVYEASGYANTWDGKANMGFPNTSKLLPVGTYFYILEIKDFSKPFNGYVYLNY